MKRIISLLSVLLAISLLLTSCISVVHKFVYEDGFLVDKSTGIRYSMTTVSYIPVARKAEYGVYNLISLYQLRDASPTEWLTEPYEGIGGLYYAEGVDVPTLEEFEPVEIIECSVDEKIIGLGTISEEEFPGVISQAIDELVNGEIVFTEEFTTTYHLFFRSDKYSFMYYDVIYVIGMNGDHYLYDRGTKRSVSIGNLISDILPD